MRTRIAIVLGAATLIAGTALAQVAPSLPDDAVPSTAERAAEAVQSPAAAETVPPGQVQAGAAIDADTRVQPSQSTPPANTAPIPNAVTGNAVPNATATDRPDANQWRYRYHNGRWWYWMPSNRWMIHDGANWISQNDFNARFQARYTGPRFREYSTPYYGGNRYGTGYRGGYYDNRPQYYQSYRGGYYQPGYGYDGRYNDRGYYDRGYYDRGYNDRGFYGPGNRPYSDGSIPGRAGANIGGAIGGAIGGQQGGNVGAAIGGAIGSQPR